MITPRTTRLVRVPDLRTMHTATAEFAAATNPLSAAGRAVLVPTRGAAERLRRTLEHRLLTGGQACVFPSFVTRGELYGRLHAALRGAPPLLSEFEREVLLTRAARIVSSDGAPPPFRLRPGLIAAILAFYDELRRHDRTVRDFERLITASLEGSADFDRGAERMLRQTRFLVSAFAEFERVVADSGSLDEHGLRARLLEADTGAGLEALLVTVADQAADAAGLWTADFDLLARLPGLGHLDIVATEQVLAAGFHERVHDLLPGLEEVRVEAANAPPVLLAPESNAIEAPEVWFTARDREEELADVAARVRTGESDAAMAVAFGRPLPYLYLARHVFADAHVSYEALDALPLAAEPFAAALDQLFTVLLSEGTRASLVELLASPHWAFRGQADGAPVTRADVRAAEAVLQRAKYVGGWERLDALAVEAAGAGSGSRSPRGSAARALSAASHSAARLRQLAAAPTASAQIHGLLDFIRAHEAAADPSAAWFEAHTRARGAILDALECLADAHRQHDETPVSMGELAGTVRRWIEGQTFSPRTGTGGIVLIDARAAAYAGTDELRLVGLVESDWPERQGRSIFYPASLLTQLGWPSERERLRSARARFRDLLHLARRRVSLSTFTLEHDAIVAPSPFLDEVSAAGLPVERAAGREWPRVFEHEALAEAPVILDAVRGQEAAAWLAMRMAAPPDEDRFRGDIGPRAATPYAVSHLERYLDCPFKYFAMHVLGLEEERDDQAGLTPQERGQLLHDVFERFFGAWRDAGRKAITAANLGDALGLFEQIAEARLATLGEADRALERTYLLGSAVAPGLAERAFAFEIEHGVEVIERLLEQPLEGEFRFRAGAEARRLAIRAKADRIDLLEDGTLRVIDYKLGRAPKPARALQLPVYGVCATQQLEGRHGRSWVVSRAGYVAFRERNAFVPLGGQGSLGDALEEGQQRLLATVARIEAGRFPVDPDEPFFCTRCGYAALCRKDYVGDE